MAGTQFDLEAIVREVMRRLQRELAADRPAVAGRDDAPVPRSADLPSIAEDKSRRADGQSPPGELPGTLVVSERVVTWAGLKDRLAGIRRLSVPAGAVLTPSVRDELRKRNIAWKTTNKASAAGESNHTDLWIAAACGPYDARAALKAVAAEALRAEQLGCGELPEMMSHLVGRIARSGAPGVLVTTQAAAAVCLANRHGELRAIWGADIPSVSQGNQTIGANLLVLDPQRHTVNELRGMVRQFLQGSHQCPADWHALLAGANSR